MRVTIVIFRRPVLGLRHRRCRARPSTSWSARLPGDPGGLLSCPGVWPVLVRATAGRHLLDLCRRGLVWLYFRRSPRLGERFPGSWPACWRAGGHGGGVADAAVARNRHDHVSHHLKPRGSASPGPEPRRRGPSWAAAGHASGPGPIIRFPSKGFGHADLRLSLQRLWPSPRTCCKTLRCPAEHLPGLRRRDLSKQVTAAGFQLKGSGWYVTDFRGGGGGRCQHCDRLQMPARRRRPSQRPDSGPARPPAARPWRLLRLPLIPPRHPFRTRPRARENTSSLACWSGCHWPSPSGCSGRSSTSSTASSARCWRLALVLPATWREGLLSSCTMCPDSDSSSWRGACC